MDESTEGSQSRLEQLGYTQQLDRRLSLTGVVGLAMANVSPTQAVLFFTAGVFVIGGTFAIGANVLLAVAVMMIALCLAELVAIYPIAGGMYSLVKNVMPAPISWITMFNFLIQGVVIPASLALGIPPFLKDLIPGFTMNDKLAALILIVIATGIALTTVEVGAITTGAMVVVELTVLSIITFAALTHPHQNVGKLAFHPVLLTNGQLSVVAVGAMLATLAPAFNVINGYDGALAFTEELKGEGKAMARAVLICAALACFLIIFPLIAAMVAAPDLKAFFNAPNPVIYSVQSALGSKARDLVDIGASIALFNGMLALLMYFGRAFYTTGRDNIWPTAMSRKLGQVNRFRAPAVAVLTIAVPAVVLIFVSAENFLIVFAGTVIAAVYFVIGLAAFWSRIAEKDIHRPYRMPLWPLAPVIVVLFTGVALATQQTKYLVSELILVVVSLAAWGASRWWRTVDPAEADPAQVEMDTV
jgi:amino acid transporter